MSHRISRPDLYASAPRWLTILPTGAHTQGSAATLSPNWSAGDAAIGRSGVA